MRVFVSNFLVISILYMAPLSRASSLKARSITEIYSANGETFHGNTVEEPYMVALNFNHADRGWFCVGTIIDALWVLTAAHCTNGSEGVEVVRQDPRIVFNVHKTYYHQHSGFNSHYNHDIALIRVPRIVFGTQLSTIQMLRRDFPGEADNTFNGAWAFGFEWPHDRDSGPIERQVISNEECIKAGYSPEVIIESTLCVATPANESACMIDAGGALMLNSTGRLIGVVSFASSNGCLAGVPVGFTRLTSHMAWIMEETGITEF